MPKSRSSTRSSADPSDFDIDQQIPGSYSSVLSTSVKATNQRSLSHALHARRKEYTEARKIRVKIGSWNVAALKGTEFDIGGWFVDGKGVEEALTGLSISKKERTDDDDSAVGEDKDHKKKHREDVEAQEARRYRGGSTLPKGDTGVIPGGEDVALYVLGLQEVVDVSSATEALRPYTDPVPAKKFKAAVEEALPLGYQLVAEQQLIGMLILIYSHANILQDLHSVSTTSVGTGFMGYMGNKGAVTARLMLGETTRLVFVNSHLSAGADKSSLDRRNWDVVEIVKRTKFDPIIDDFGVPASEGEKIGDENFAFWFGDLNYRLEGMPGDDVRRLLTLHTRNEYDLNRPQTAQKIEEALETDGDEESASDTLDPSDPAFPAVVSLKNDHTLVDEEETLHHEVDPASLQATLNSLLPHDELQQQMKAGKAFHEGWKEGDIKFLPTYKYDAGSVGIFDSSDKRRCPSWCDRILYRSRRTLEEYKRLAKEASAAGKPLDGNNVGRDGYDEDANVMFDYDPNEDGASYDHDTDSTDTDEPQDLSDIELEYYVAHQRVLSSDHKPLDAVFTLSYDKVNAEVKSRIHAEVARELDRTENETRPTITIVVEKSQRSGSEDGASTGSAASSVKDGHGGMTEQCFVDFGHLHEGERKVRTVTVANTGQVPASLSFVNRPVADGSAEGPFPPWLAATWDKPADGPTKKKNSKNNPNASYTLQPGDVANVDLEVNTTGLLEIVKQLDEGTAKLDDVLILRVANGRDYFLPIAAKLVTHSIEKSIGKLKEAISGGMRRLQGQKPVGATEAESGTPSRSAFASPETT